MEVSACPIGRVTTETAEISLEEQGCGGGGGGVCTGVTELQAPEELHGEQPEELEELLAGNEVEDRRVITQQELEKTQRSSPSPSSSPGGERRALQLPVLGGVVLILTAFLWVVRFVIQSFQELSCKELGLPSFAVYSGNLALQKRFYAHPELKDRATGRGFAQELDEHPCRTVDEEAADFEFVCCQVGEWQESVESSEKLLQLPLRDSRRPWVIFTGMRYGVPYGRGQIEAHQRVMNRSDFVFLTMDRRGYTFVENDVEPLDGITMASPQFWTPQSFFWGPRLDEPPKYFLTFRGSLNALGNTVRKDLQSQFKRYSSSAHARADVQVCILPHCEQPNFPSFQELMRTAYALVPRGHGRWSYRFQEVIGACVIPVIISDGWIAPFESLINWSAISFHFPENITKGKAEDLIDRLPADFETIRSMRKAVCEVNRRYFATERRRMEAVLKSLRQHMRDLGGQRA